MYDEGEVGDQYNVNSGIIQRLLYDMLPVSLDAFDLISFVGIFWISTMV